MMCHAVAVSINCIAFEVEHFTWSHHRGLWTRLNRKTFCLSTRFPALIRHTQAHPRRVSRSFYLQIVYVGPKVQVSCNNLNVESRSLVQQIPQFYMQRYF